MNDVCALAYEDYKNGMSCKDIAEKYGVKKGTVKSWTCRHWKNGVASPTESVATVATKSATAQPSVLAASWADIETEYVTDISMKPCTLASLSKKYSIPAATIEQQSMLGKWRVKRDEYKEQTKQKALEKTAEITAGEIAVAVARQFSLSGKLLDRLEKALLDGGELAPKDLLALAGVLEKGQKIQGVISSRYEDDNAEENEEARLVEALQSSADAWSDFVDDSETIEKTSADNAVVGSSANSR
ncbi:hypothetical protein AGMMS49975_29790 [Clostridia bacterium]|nr:hypothetical protein AGMMS49975_29790 [Clostridia bacterium]